MAQSLAEIRAQSSGGPTGTLTLAQIKAKSSPSSTSLASTIWGDIANRGASAYNAVTDTTRNPIVSGVKAAAEGAGAISDTGRDVIEAVPGAGGILKTIGKVISKPFKAATDALSDTKLFKEAAQYPEHTRTLEDFLSAGGSLGEIAGTVLGADGAAATAAKSAAAVRSLTTKSEEAIERSIVTNYEKGVKPGLAGRNTNAKQAQYREDIIEGAKTIRDNKLNLELTGEPANAFEGSGQVPTSLQGLSDAIEQTKRVIFDQYDGLATRAGNKGLELSTEPIGTELDAVIGSKSLALTNPRAIAYAKELKQRYGEIGTLDAKTAQEVIQNYNKSLEAFYRNPSYDTASQAAIDAMVANKLRQALDDGISGITGEQYSALKRQYGSLKSIEKDVVKAALRDARKNTKGLIDFADIFSGGQVVNGILSLNPHVIASGAAQKAITEFYKYLNDPNRAIERMFKEVDKLPR
ncbi:hypothetical protein [Dongia sp.]|uniref:hypothetical protein n=1 Tax=Dongia sp. TaxID=1977262 RepID=UPI00375392F0